MCETKIRVSTVCEDIQVTLCLPSAVINVDPESITDFAELNRQKYEKAIGDMHADVDQVDSSFEKEAQELMELAVEELEMIIQDKILRDFSNIKDVEQWSLAHAASKKLNTHIKGISNEYDEDLKSLEVKRKDQTAEILLKYKEEITTKRLIDYDKVRERFQDEITRINEKTISNLQKIADFNLYLQVRGREIQDSIKEKLKNKAKYIAEKDAQNLWQKLIEKQHKNLLEETIDNLRQKNYQIREDIVQAKDNLVSSLSNMTETFKLSDTIMEDGKLWDYFIKKLNSRLEVFDKKCNNLAVHLKSAIETLMNNFDNHMNLLNRLLRTKLEENEAQNNDVLPLNTPTDLRVLNVNPDEEIEELKRIVDVVTDIIDNKIKQVSTFVDDIKSIWTDYLSNINDMHKQLTVGWEAFNANYVKLKAGVTFKVKSQSKSIREAKDLNKLNSITNDVDKMINVTEEKLNSEYESQISILLKLKNKKVESIVEQKLSSIKNFLNVKYQKSTWLHKNIENDYSNLNSDTSPNLYTRHSSNLDSDNSSNLDSVHSLNLISHHSSNLGSYNISNLDSVHSSNLISHHNSNLNSDNSSNLDSYSSQLDCQIDKCNTFMNAVDNETQGMYELLEGYLAQCEVDVVTDCDEWFTTFLEDVTPIHKIDMADFVQTQREAIEDLKNVRSAELIYHSDRLLSHNRGVKVVTSQLNHEFNDLKIRKQSLLTEFVESKSRVIQNSPTDSSKQIKFAIAELENQFDSIRETLENAVTEAKEQCIKQLDIVEQSNNLFSKTAKMFKNGGNYSLEESKTLNKELNKLRKECTSLKKNLLNKYHDLLSGITNQLLDTEIEQLKEKLEKVSLEEKLSDEISALRFILRSEVENMKTSGRKIDKSIKSLSSLSKMDEKLLYDMIHMMNQRYDYMIFPPEMSSFEPLYLNDNHNDIEVDSKRTTPSKQNKSKKQPDTKSLNLFVNVSDENISIMNNYFARTKGVMMKKYKYLNQYVRDKLLPTVNVVKDKTLNTKKKNIQNKESDSIPDYMKEIKPVILNYNKECELAWFCEAKLIIDQIISLRKYISSVIKQGLKLKHKEYKLRLESLQNEFQYKIETKQNKQNVNREKIQQTLVLPLAHPNHQQKLTDLLKKASTLSKTQNTEFDIVVNSYKEDLQNTHDEYVEEIKELKEKLTNIQSLVSDQLSNKLDDLIGKVESISHLVQSDLDQLEVEHNDCEYPKSIWSVVDSYSCSSLRSSSTLRVGNEDEREYSVNSNATALVKESAELIQKLYDEAKLSQSKNEKCISEWLNDFERNVDQCKRVYKSICN